MDTLSYAISAPRPPFLPRRRYAEDGRTRHLLEFTVDPTWPPPRCAWCGCPDDLDDRRFVGPFEESIHFRRVFPGPRFVTDGYVGVCSNCLKLVVDDHAEPTDWAGVAILNPVRACPIDVPCFGYADDARVAAAVGHVWDTVPERDRVCMIFYLVADGREFVDGQPPVALGRLRIETLPKWPSWDRDALGANMVDGHVLHIWAEPLGAWTTQLSPPWLPTSWLTPTSMPHPR